jgi:hypothetical protein
MVLVPWLRATSDRVLHGEATTKDTIPPRRTAAPVDACPAVGRPPGLLPNAQTRFIGATPGKNRLAIVEELGRRDAVPCLSQAQ